MPDVVTFSPSAPGTTRKPFAFSSSSSSRGAGAPVAGSACADLAPRANGASPSCLHGRHLRRPVPRRAHFGDDGLAEFVLAPSCDGDDDTVHWRAPSPCEGPASTASHPRSRFTISLSRPTSVIWFAERTLYGRPSMVLDAAAAFAKHERRRAMVPRAADGSRLRTPSALGDIGVLDAAAPVCPVATMRPDSRRQHVIANVRRHVADEQRTSRCAILGRGNAHARSVQERSRRPTPATHISLTCRQMNPCVRTSPCSANADHDAERVDAGREVTGAVERIDEPHSRSPFTRATSAGSVCDASSATMPQTASANADPRCSCASASRSASVTCRRCGRAVAL